MDTLAVEALTFHHDSSEEALQCIYCQNFLAKRMSMVEERDRRVRLEEAEWWAPKAMGIAPHGTGAKEEECRDRLAAHRAAVQEKPELTPCPRHGKEFWETRDVQELIGGQWSVETHGHCTACAQEKAAGAASQGES